MSSKWERILGLQAADTRTGSEDWGEHPLYDSDRPEERKSKKSVDRNGGKKLAPQILKKVRGLSQDEIDSLFQ